jgi:hypothetical protein
MSREERRAYQRQMKSMERGPALPPGAKERAERNAARRAQRKARTPEPAAAGTLGLRFWIRAVLIAVVLGFLAFSLQWGEGMPRAMYVGLAVGGLALVLQVGIRFLQRRLPARS